MALFMKCVFFSWYPNLPATFWRKVTWKRQVPGQVKHHTHSYTHTHTHNGDINVDLKDVGLTSWLDFRSALTRGIMCLAKSEVYREPQHPSSSGTGWPAHLRLRKEQNVLCFVLVLSSCTVKMTENFKRNETRPNPQLSLRPFNKFKTCFNPPLAINSGNNSVWALPENHFL